MTKYVTPTISDTAFSCPHCSVLTAQTWYDLYARQIDSDSATPFFHPANTDWDSEFSKLRMELQSIDERLIREIVDSWRRQQKGEPELAVQGSSTFVTRAINCSVCVCWHCKKLSLWIGRSMVYPGQPIGVQPNPDLPEEIIRDFQEARRILNESPRGAAAILRLCVEKLCGHLGASGRTLDEKIGDLVGKGLDDRVKDALDVVRVIGNKAVHDGRIDDGDTSPEMATQLLVLVNEIAVDMISKPRRLASMKAKLPPEVQAAIDRRDAKAKSLSDGEKEPR